MQQVKFKKGDCSANIGVQQEGKRSEWRIRMLFVHYPFHIKAHFINMKDMFHRDSWKIGKGMFCDLFLFC